MAEGFITRRGGGSANLNFEVVGSTTQPTSPKENTIWVETSVEITGYHFGNAEPVGEEGMVWILSDWTGGSNFNALKNNSIMVYPSLVSQYINGTWQQITSLLYQNGAWNELWDGYIYYQGDLKERITGGWEHKAGNSGSISYGSNYLRVSASGASGESCIYGTKKKIDFTKAKTIEVIWSSSNGNRSRLDLRNDSGSTITSILTTSSMQGSKHTSYLDISGVTGEYYLCAGVWFAETTSISNTIYSIKLEF